MKKLVTILLLLIYLPAVSGVTVDSFYCCGKLTTINLQLQPNEATANKAKSSNNQKVTLGCCNHVIQSFQIQNSQQQTPFKVSFNAPILSAGLIPFCISTLNNTTHTIDHTCLKSPPPLLGNLPLFISNESFLI